MTPRDALGVINYLSRTGEGSQSERTDSVFDVNLDGEISPLDALVIINRLGRQQNTQSPALEYLSQIGYSSSELEDLIDEDLLAFLAEDGLADNNLF
ncbi:MAG: hypothetical protein KDB00_22565 [Planctomycetales bacterium]|nr:hypothetical protein [Planctomycetales bacterium]